MSARFIRYVEGESRIHSMDPRVKLTLLLSLLFSLTVSPDMLSLLPPAAVSAAFYLAARLPWEKTKGTWKVILAVAVVLSALNYLTIAALYSGVRTPGEFLAKLSSPDVLSRGFTPVLKLITLAVATATFVFTTPPNLYAPALGQMGLPYRGAYVIQLALRYVPEFLEEMRKTLEAQMARGYRPVGGRNPVARLISVVPLVVPVTISAALSIYDIADAMELRGFGERDCHTWYRSLKIGRGEIAVLLVALMMAAAYAASMLVRILG